MGLVDRIKGLWRRETTRVVHGWIGAGDGSTATKAGGQPPGTAIPANSRYVELIIADFGLRFEKDRAAKRSPVFASAVTWKSPGGADVKISKTLSDDSLASIGADESVVTIHSEVPLSPLLPIGANNVEYTVGLLSAPGTSLFAGVAGFISSVAEMTQLTELTAVGKVADKVATGVDEILGNDEIEGRIGFHGAVLASDPRAGYYVVTSRDSAESRLEDLAVVGGKLRMRIGDASVDPEGFDYLLLQVAVRGSQPDRWRDIPSVAGPWKIAEDKLAQATTEQAVTEAGVSFKLAVANARNDPNLAVGDRDLAAEAILSNWRRASEHTFVTGGGDAAGFADGTDPAVLLGLARSIAEDAEA